MHRNFPIVDFIRCVWGFTPDDIPEGNYELSYYLAFYLKQGFYNKGIDDSMARMFVEGDRRTAADFCDLIDSCFVMIERHNDASKSKKEVPLPGHIRFNHGRMEIRFPPPNPTFHYDLAYSLPCEEIKWQYIGVFGELRKTRRMLDRAAVLPTRTKIDLTRLKVKSNSIFHLTYLIHISRVTLRLQQKCL